MASPVLPLAASFSNPISSIKEDGNTVKHPNFRHFVKKCNLSSLLEERVIFAENNNLGR